MTTQHALTSWLPKVICSGMPILQWVVSLTSPACPKDWAGCLSPVLPPFLLVSFPEESWGLVLEQVSRQGNAPEAWEAEGCSYFAPTRSSRKVRSQPACSVSLSTASKGHLTMSWGPGGGGGSACPKGSASSAVPAVSTVPGNAVASLIEPQHKVCQSFKLRWAGPFAACESGGLQRDTGSMSPLTSSSWSLVKCAQVRAHGACFPLSHLT